MANSNLMKLRISVVSCPLESLKEEGVGKSTLCQQFVYGREAKIRTKWTEKEWNMPLLNNNHFIYWGSKEISLPGGPTVNIRVIEQSTIWQHDNELPYPSPFDNYIKQASQIYLPSPGKKACRPEQVSMYALIDRNPSPEEIFNDEDDMSYPDREFTEEGVSGFLCLVDCALTGDRYEKQLLFLKNFSNAISGAINKRIGFVLTKCDASNEKRIEELRNFIKSKLKKQIRDIPLVDVVATENFNVKEGFIILAQRCLKSKNLKQALNWPQYKQNRVSDRLRQTEDYQNFILKTVCDSSWTWMEFWEALKTSSQKNIANFMLQKDLKRQFCLRILELKLKEAGESYSVTPIDKINTLNSICESSHIDKNTHLYQEYLWKSLISHPDLTPFHHKQVSHYDSVDLNPVAVISKNSYNSENQNPPLPPRKCEPAVSPDPIVKLRPKLNFSQRMIKTMSWSGRSKFNIASPEPQKEWSPCTPTNVITDTDITLFHNTLSSVNNYSRILSDETILDQRGEYAFNRGIVLSSSGKYHNRPLPPSPNPKLKTIKKSFPPALSPQPSSAIHIRSRSDTFSNFTSTKAPDSSSFPDLTILPFQSSQGVTPYLDPAQLKTFPSPPRDKHSSISDSVTLSYSKKPIECKLSHLSDLHSSQLANFCPNAENLFKIDASAQTYTRGQRRREHRWCGIINLDLTSIQHNIIPFLTTSEQCSDNTSDHYVSGTASVGPEMPIIVGKMQNESIYENSDLL